jgi:hypothetical protein
MLSRLVLAFSVVGVLALAGASFAEAGYVIPPLTAKHIAREESEAFCENEGGCYRYGWGCEPAGRGALCVLTSFFEDQYGEMECEGSMHLVIGAGGYIRKSYGKPHCFYVE